MSIHAILNRFSKSGDLGHLSARFHSLDRGGKMAVVEKVSRGEDPAKAIDAATERSEGEISRLRVGAVFRRNGQEMERVDARRYRKRVEFHTGQVDLVF